MNGQLVQVCRLSHSSLEWIASVVTLRQEVADLRSEVERLKRENLEFRQQAGYWKSRHRDALQRIAAGVYGRCEYCGGKIAEARLNALPYTNTCIDCQRENERAGQSRALEPDSKRWAKVYEKPT